MKKTSYAPADLNEGFVQHQETAHFKTIIPQLLPRIAKRERVPFVPYFA